VKPGVAWVMTSTDAAVTMSTIAVAEASPPSSSSGTLAASWGLITLT
jgi:hypothetical protein